MALDPALGETAPCDLASSDDTPASVSVRAGDGQSDVVRARPSGNLRLLFPRAAGRAAWVVTSSFGGGLVHGDQVALELSIETGATALLTTQASTKVYRGSSRQRTLVRVGEGGVALVVPDPVVPFRDAEFTQLTRVELEAGASLLLTDVITAGRVAHGERWRSTSIDTSLTVDTCGRALLIDRLILSQRLGDVGERLTRFEAIGTAVVVGPRFEVFARELHEHVAASPIEKRAPLLVAASPLRRAPSHAPCGVFVRLAAARVELATDWLRHVLGPACAALGEDPWSRKW